MRLFLIALAIALGAPQAWALSPVQIAVVTPAYQAPGWTAWTPSSLGAALKADWRASDLSDGAVASWPDTVAALSPAQATGSLQPVKSATACNGQPGVTFDGVDDLLSVESTTGIPTGSTSGEIWIAAVSAANNGTTQPFVRYGAGVGAYRGVAKTSSRTISVSDGTTTVLDPPILDISAGIVGGIYVNGAYARQYNGNLNTRLSGTLNTATTRVRFGSDTNNTPAAWMNGVLCEVAVTTALSESDRQKLEGYYAFRYAMPLLPWNHPYRFRAP
jgi:phage-related protein